MLPNCVVNLCGFRTTTTYDPVGQATAVNDALNQRTTTVYDVAGQPTVTIDALAGAKPSFTTRLDAASATSIRSASVPPPSWTWPARAWPRSTRSACGTTLVFDAEGNQVGDVSRAEL